MKTDIEIAQECTMEPITAIAEKAGIPDEYLEQYGKYKAKIDYNFLKKSQNEAGGHSCQHSVSIQFYVGRYLIHFPGKYGCR